MLDIGNRVKKARLQAGLTQKELAKRSTATQTVISDIENGRNKNSSSLYSIAVATGVNPDWLLHGEGEMKKKTPVGFEGDNFKTVPQQSMRLAPVLNYVQAGSFCEYFDDAIADRMEAVPNNIEGENLYWLIIDGLSMIPDFYPQDMILVNPDLQPNPGDFVVAMKANEKSVTFKKWRPRGFDDSGIEYSELVPSNPDFPIIDSRHMPFEVCGVAVRYIKNLR